MKFNGTFFSFLSFFLFFIIDPRTIESSSVFGQTSKCGTPAYISGSASMATKDPLYLWQRMGREGMRIDHRARQVGVHSWQTDKLIGSKVVRLIARNGEYKSAIEYASLQRRRDDEFVTLSSLFRVCRSTVCVYALWLTRFNFFFLKRRVNSNLLRIFYSILVNNLINDDDYDGKED